MMQHVPNRTTVVGVFSDRDDAERAIDDLQVAGFREDQLGVLARGDTTMTRDAAQHDAGTKAPEGAATGAVVGGIIGAAASLLIPGVGPVLAGGILAGVLGSTVIGAAAGGIIGGLAGLGIPEDEARYYEGEFKAGRTIVTVKADSRYDEARSILRAAGAYDVYDRNPMPTATPGMTDTTRTGTMGTGTMGTGTSRPTTSGTYGDTVRDPLPGEPRTGRRDLP